MICLLLLGIGNIQQTDVVQFKSVCTGLATLTYTIYATSTTPVIFWWHSIKVIIVYKTEEEEDSIIYHRVIGLAQPVGYVDILNISAVC